jgi:hypothetical protein
LTHERYAFRPICQGFKGVWLGCLVLNLLRHNALRPSFVPQKACPSGTLAYQLGPSRFEASSGGESQSSKPYPPSPKRHRYPRDAASGPAAIHRPLLYRRLSDPSHRYRRRHEGPAFASRGSKLGQCQVISQFEFLLPTQSGLTVLDGVELTQLGRLSQVNGRPQRLRSGEEGNGNDTPRSKTVRVTC